MSQLNYVYVHRLKVLVMKYGPVRETTDIFRILPSYSDYLDISLYWTDRMSTFIFWITSGNDS